MKEPRPDPDDVGAPADRSDTRGRWCCASASACAYRFTRDDYKEVAAVFKGTHPETGEELRVVHPAPEGFPWPDAPAQDDVFAPDYATEEIAEIARSLRQRAGFPAPTGAEIRVVDRRSERKAAPGSGA